MKGPVIGAPPAVKYLRANQKGAANGVAPLGEDKKLPAENLPEISAGDVKFTDGTTFQQKLDAGELKGAPGDPGTPGNDGESAYEAAKAAGYTGTEEEFNALLYIMDQHASRHEAGGADPIDISKLAGVLTAAQGGTGVASLDELANALSGSLAGAKIQTGSYTGTGTYGASNPCSLTFDFVPTVVLIQQKAEGAECYLTVLNGVSKAMSFHSADNESSQSVAITWADNTMSWYSTAGMASDRPTYQLNQAATEYSWAAIG